MKKLMTICLCTAALMALPVSLFAFGIGAYGDFGYGNDRLKHKSSSIMNRSISGNTMFAGGGLLVDTNVARNRLFNYRLNLGGGQLFADMATKPRLYRFDIINSFGFGVVRTKWIRFWLGPQFNLHYIWGGRNVYDYGVEATSILVWYYTGALLYVGPLKEKIRHEIPGISLGAVLGVNLNLGDSVSLTTDAGSRYYLTDGRNNVRRVYGLVSVAPSTYVPFYLVKYKDRATWMGWEVFVNVGFMVRFRDRYVQLGG